MRISPMTKTIAALGISLTVALTGIPFMPSAAVPTAQAYSAQTANQIVATGKRYLHRPYEFGASVGSTRTFDCSSFTKHVYGKHGISLPRTSRQQAKVGSYVSKSNLRKGDLLFFSTASSRGKVAHVGIYAGNGKILHTYGKPGVTYSDLDSSWWRSHYITARRVL